MELPKFMCFVNVQSGTEYGRQTYHLHKILISAKTHSKKKLARDGSKDNRVMT